MTANSIPEIGVTWTLPFFLYMTRNSTGHKSWARTHTLGRSNGRKYYLLITPPYSNRAHNNGQWAKMSLNMLSLSSLQHTVVSSSASNCPFMSRVLYSPAFSRTKIETRVYFQRGGPMKFQLKMRNMGPLKYTLVETMPVFRHPGKFVNMGPLGGRFYFTPHTSAFKVMIGESDRLVKVTAPPPLWSLKVGGAIFENEHLPDIHDKQTKMHQMPAGHDSAAATRRVSTCAELRPVPRLPTVFNLCSVPGYRKRGRVPPGPMKFQQKTRNVGPLKYTLLSTRGVPPVQWKFS